MAHPRLPRLILLLALAATACRLVEPADSGAVSATSTTEGILVSNQTGYAIQVYSIAEVALPLWDTVQCINGTVVSAGEAHVFPWKAIYTGGAQSPSDRYRTMWWRDGACSFGTDDEPRGAMVVVR